MFSIYRYCRRAKFFTGLASVNLYNGQILKGILLIIFQGINGILHVCRYRFQLRYPIVWIWGMYDAYKTAER